MIQATIIKDGKETICQIPSFWEKVTYAQYLDLQKLPVNTLEYLCYFLKDSGLNLEDINEADKVELQSALSFLLFPELMKIESKFNSEKYKSYLDFEINIDDMEYGNFYFVRQAIREAYKNEEIEEKDLLFGPKLIEIFTQKDITKISAMEGIVIVNYCFNHYLEFMDGYKTLNEDVLTKEQKQASINPETGNYYSDELGLSGELYLITRGIVMQWKDAIKLETRLVYELYLVDHAHAAINKNLNEIIESKNKSNH